MFRLELLENIFSLLFLSTADLTQQKETTSNTCSAAQWEHLSSTDRHSQKKYNTCEVENENQEQSSGSMKAAPSHYLDLGHFVQGCRGFLPDVTAVEGFLKLLKDALEDMCVVGQQAGQETGRAKLAERISCSVKADTYGTRLQRLSKHIAEAQWRLQIITSNHGAASGEKNITKMFSYNPHEFSGVWGCNLIQNVSFVILIRVRKSCPSVWGQSSTHFCGTQQELKPEEKEEGRETLPRETGVHRETPWGGQHQPIR